MSLPEDSGNAPASPALGAPEQSTFGFRHRHSGLSGDGARVKATSLDTADPFTVNSEPTYTPINAATSGRKYQIQVIEVTDPETQQISPVLQVVLVTPTP